MTPERNECDVHGLTPDEHCSVLEACLQEVPGDMLEGDGDQPHDAVERLRLAWEAAERRAEEAEKDRDAFDADRLHNYEQADMWRHRAEAAEAALEVARRALIHYGWDEPTDDGTLARAVIAKLPRRTP